MGGRKGGSIPLEIGCGLLNAAVVAKALITASGSASGEIIGTHIKQQSLPGSEELLSPLCWQGICIVAESLAAGSIQHAP